jgi:hypothetical protein
MIDFTKPEIQLEIYEYVNSLDLSRNKRWGDVSHKFNDLNIYTAVTIQGLGRLDSKLIVEDEILIKTGKPKNPFGDLSEHITLSYLWVLGAYELVRSLTQKAKNDNNFFPSFKESLSKLKSEFERIRIPLAKFEPAKKHSDTDNYFAYPVVFIGAGIGWKTSEQFGISRRDLSDKMISLLEEMKI